MLKHKLKLFQLLTSQEAQTCNLYNFCYVPTERLISELQLLKYACPTTIRQAISW